MGILNVTPDSFSDGGKHVSLPDAVDAALRMQADGADIIDIGGESTRPYSLPVDAEEELDRVLPVITALRGRVSIPISIDTSKSIVAAAAISAGAEIINDVTGLEGDADMTALAASTGAAVCVMHTRGDPRTMQDNPQYGDVVGEIHHYLSRRLRWCLDHGIDQTRICLDPGIGFGKTHEHNMDLIRQMRRFTDLGCPLMIGHSRKGFIGKWLGDSRADRDAATLGVTLALALAGVSIVRVHAVRPTVDAIRLFAACLTP